MHCIANYQLLTYRSQELEFELTDFTGRSDYGPFIENGIPGSLQHLKPRHYYYNIVCLINAP